jgi:MFS family permease
MDSTAHFDTEIQKNFKVNFTVNLMDVAFYMFGYSFFDASTILPVFVSHFTQNPILIGLIPFINTAGFLVPQLFSSNFVERAPVKKFFPFNLGLFFERLPILLIVISTFFFAGRSPALALLLFFLFYAFHTAGAGFLMVGWQDMIAKIIPVDKRGRFFGLSNFIGKLTGIAGASTVAWLLSLFAFPKGYVIAFGCTAVCIFISWIFLGLSREPPDPVTKPHISHSAYYRGLPAIIRSNPNFRKFLLTQIVSSFGAMAGGFIVIFAIHRWDIPDSLAATYGISLAIGQSFANLAFGFLADQKGHKIVLEISILLNVLSFLVAIVSPSPIWFYLTFALRGMSLGGNFVSGLALPLEFSKPEDRPTFIGLAGTIPGIAGAIAPFLGGVLANLTSYTLLFTISILIAICAFAMMHWFVKDPRHFEAQYSPTG